jgi:SurA-like N-terminal domain
MATKKKITKKSTAAAKKSTPVKKATKKTVAASSKAPSKTTTPKTTTPVQKTSVEPKVSTASSAQAKSAETKPIKIRKAYVILVACVIIFAALLYFFRGWFVAAVVNGQPVSRMSVIKEAEKQSGKQALDTLVRNDLIEQEARKQNVTVSDKEIDDEIKKVEAQLAKQGQKIDQVLAMQGMNRNDLRRLIRLDKLVGKIVGKDIKVSDKEIDAYIEKNKDALPQGQSETELRASVKEQLNQQKLNAKVQTWLADVQKKANIMYFVQY